MLTLVAGLYGPLLFSVGLDKGRLRLAITAAYWMVLAAYYFFRLPKARYVPLALIPAQALSLFGRPEGYQANVLAIFLLSSAMMTAPLFSTRNKLAFRVEVSARELERYYDKYLSNPMAGRALAYSFLFLLIPLMNVFSLAFGVRAFRKASEDAWPPVGGKTRAIVGVAISARGLLAWAVYFIRLALE